MGTDHAGNADIARALSEIADLLEVQGASPSRTGAYRRAAHTVAKLKEAALRQLAAAGDAGAEHGIGADLGGKVLELLDTGRCEMLERLRSDVPPGLVSLLRLPLLGPRRVHALHQELGVRSLAELHEAARSGRLRGVQGFGPRLQQQILHAVELTLAAPSRWRHDHAAALAAELLALTRTLPGVERAEAAGSLRRGRDSVGRLVLLAQAGMAAPSPPEGSTPRVAGERIVDGFVHGPEVAEVLLAGPTRASVRLHAGLSAELHLTTGASFGAAWVHFTGNEAHDTALRQLARQRGLRLDAEGVFRGRTRLAGADEPAVYGALGLPWIAPELREGRGEISAARHQALPQLVELSDLRGDLHVHTRSGDGVSDLPTLVDVARARGLDYLAVTDHAPRAAAREGPHVSRLTRQIDAIDRLNAGLDAFTLLKGVEVDILEDGQLALPDALLARLDLVIGAVHQHLELPRRRQTARLMRAMDHPHFGILAHPLCRLIGGRPGIDIDLTRVLRHARARGCSVELNARPARLDLDDEGCMLARAEGVLVSIASDAHGAGELGHLAAGVRQARRGWLTAPGVLNARPLQALRPLLLRAGGAVPPLR